MPTSPPDTDQIIKTVFPGAKTPQDFCPQCGDPAIERNKWAGGTFKFCSQCKAGNGKSLAWSSKLDWDRLKMPTADKITHGAAAWIKCNMGHTMASNDPLCTQCWGEDGGDPSGYVRAVEAVNPGQKWDHERKYVGAEPEPDPDWL